MFVPSFERRTVRNLCLVYGAIAGLVAASVAQAHEVAYVATLAAANDSPGVGIASVVVDLDLFTLDLAAAFNDVQGTSVSAHVHGVTATPGAGSAGIALGEPTLPGFSLGQTAGTYEHLFDLAQASTYATAFFLSHGATVDGAATALLAGLAEGRTYFDIHTLDGGAVGGFLLPTPKADFNTDGVVAGGDLAEWSEAFGIEHHGDANDDEFTDGADLLIWQEQLGAVAQLPQAVASLARIPEPPSTHLVGAACAAVAARGARGRPANAMPLGDVGRARRNRFSSCKKS